MSDGKAHLAAWVRLDQAVEELQREEVPVEDVCAVVQALYRLFSPKEEQDA